MKEYKKICSPDGEVHPSDALLSSPIQVKGTSRNIVKSYAGMSSGLHTPQFIPSLKTLGILEAII